MIHQFVSETTKILPTISHLTHNPFLQQGLLCFCTANFYAAFHKHYFLIIIGRSSVRRILKRGGPGTSENLRRTKIRIRNCSTQNQSDLSPKLGEEQKEKVFTQI